MPPPQTLDALCLGETMVMVTPQVAVPLQRAESCVLRAGGAESNVAMFLAALGHPVAWTSRLGDDPLGEVVLEAVRRTGVDTSLVEIAADEQTGVYFKDPSPEGTRVYYYRSTSAASRMSPAFAARFRTCGARVLHVSGITAALSDTCEAFMHALVIDRLLGGASVSFDVNYRRGLWPREAAAPVLLRLAQAADIVFVGLDEAAELWGTTTAQDVRQEVSAPRWLIVRDGPRSALEFGPSAVAEVPALKVKVVEPVGAGDAFAAGWLSAWLRGLPERSRLRLGHLIAGVALSSTSDHADLPPEEDLQARLQLDDVEWSR